MKNNNQKMPVTIGNGHTLKTRHTNTQAKPNYTSLLNKKLVAANVSGLEIFFGDTYEHFAMFLGLVVAPRVVDGHGQFGGHLFAHSVVEHVLHLTFRLPHVVHTLFLALQQVHHQLVDLHVLLVALVRVRLRNAHGRRRFMGGTSGVAGGGQLPPVSYALPPGYSLLQSS